MYKTLWLSCLILQLMSCSSFKKTTETGRLPRLRFLSSIEIPYNQQFQNTTIGGLSSIDYDAKNQLYYFLSDDRSILNPARFYTAKVYLNNQTLDSIGWIKAVTLKNAQGTPYSNWKKEPSASIDPEEMRYNPKTKTLVWSAEGARELDSKPSLLQNPSLTNCDTKGTLLSTYTLPQNLYMQETQTGPRSNGTLESISFDAGYKTLFSCLEEPLYQDDTQASLTKGGLVRLYAFDTKSQKNTAQYAYLLDPVAHAPVPENGFMVNGVTALQHYKNKELLVVERSYAVGKTACTIKVFWCEYANATNIIEYNSLQTKTFLPITKKLILNMDSLGMHIDNVEGLCFGPRLANGKRSLLFVTDNNFSDLQKTQLLLFEVD